MTTTTFMGVMFQSVLLLALGWELTLTTATSVYDLRLLQLELVHLVVAGAAVWTGSEAPHNMLPLSAVALDKLTVN